MYERKRAFLPFIRHFFHNAYRVRGVLVGLIGSLVLGGVVISQVEQIELGKAIYFAFITGMSVGYGDITPATGFGCLITVLIGMVGILFVGLTAAIATRSLSDLVQQEKEG